MDLFSLFILTLLFFGPLLITILYFIKILLKIPSVFTFQLLLSDLAILLWGFAGIPVLVQQDIFFNHQLITIEHLGVIFGSISFIILFFSFNHPYLGIKQILIARIGIISFGILAGIKIAGLLINDTSSSIYGLFIDEGDLKRYTSPFITLIVLIAFVSLVITLFMHSYANRKFPNYLVSDSVKKKSFFSAYLMTIGVAFNYVGLILSIQLLGISNILFLISRFFITFAFIFITLMIADHPVITIRERGNTKFLIDKGIIGWILVNNADNGPEINAISEKSKKVYNISDKEMILFAVSSITMAGIGQNFVNSEFIIPFPLKENELSVVCQSFEIVDPTLQDPRRNHLADVVFGIIIPKPLVNYLGSIVKGSFSINEKIISFNTFQEFIKGTDFSLETSITLRNLLIQKFT